MKTPRHPIWLILLAVFLSFSTGFRLMDYVVCVNHFSEEPVFDSQGIYLVSALCAPILVVPWTFFWCVWLLIRYPAQPISLFYWFPEKWGKQVLVGLFFGFLILERLMMSFQFAGYSGLFAGMGDDDHALDAAYNAMAALGGATFWGCLRALASYRLGTHSAASGAVNQGA